MEDLLEGVPEFVERFMNLVEAADGDPGASAAFTELAEFIASLLSRGAPSLELLARCLATVEQVARESDDAEELVGWSFLEGLCPDDLERLSPWLGPHTRAMAQQLDGAFEVETQRSMGAS